MPAEPPIPPELAGFLQQLRSLVPPPFGLIEEGGPTASGHRVTFHPVNASSPLVTAVDPDRLCDYLGHISNHGAAILAQVEQVILGLANRANAAEHRPMEPFPGSMPPKPRLAPDSCAEDALHALMQYVLSLRGIL